MQLSRRYFFSIMTLIGILFVAFILTESAKEILGDYEVNAYAVDKDSLYTRADMIETEMSEKYVVFYGRNNTTMKTLAKEWAAYRKFSFKPTNDSSEILKAINSGKKPQIVLVQGSILTDKDVENLVKVNGRGVSIVFMDLPDTKTLMENKNLLDLVGVTGVESPKQEITGYHVLSGTLIGGEQYYTLDNLKPYELERMDMELETVWYRLASGTKMYMTGMLDIPESKDGEVIIEADQYPPIMWRHTWNDAYVFSVNGDYMKSIAGIGFLSTFMSDSAQYDIYPIINSQSLVLANVPMFTDENYDAIFSIYERSASSLLRDVLWSGISVIAIRQNANITCMVSPQLVYDDDILPSNNLVQHFNRQIRQQHAEAGISVSQHSNVNIINKMTQDYDFYKENMPEYQFQSAYIEDLKPAEAINSIKLSGFENIYAVVGNHSEDDDLIKYVSPETLYFNATGDALTHTYSQDLMMRSIQTALGYSMICTDLEKVIYPKDINDEWQEVYDSMASNLSTYYKDYSRLRQTSVSEASQAARIFLNTEVETTREDNIISIDINHDDPIYFILRVRFENVEKMTGASYIKMDENTYLVTTRNKHVEIKMRDNNEKKYK